MESRLIEITSKKNKKIKMGIIPGHFATNHSHINYYVDMTTIKTNHSIAKLAAKELASEYRDTYIDTIICLEGTEMIGAFLADALTKPGEININEGKGISVITPELNTNNQMIFRDNIQKSIYSKRILLLISSTSTGKTINRSTDCLKYYNGNLVAIASIFSAAKHVHDLPVKSIFTADELPNYKTQTPADCELCKNGVKVDAIVNSYGYSKI